MPLREAPMREFDVVLFGATGYTGEYTARTLHQLSSVTGLWRGVRWAIAGRSASKLKAITEKHGLVPSGVIVADTSDAGSLIAMAARGAVVMNATGPFRFHGEGVVEACIAARTDYVDLCGEPEFIERCMLKHHDAARAAGVVIVHACAFDSVPADIGTLYTAMQFEPPMLCAQAEMFHTISVEGSPAGAYGHATTFYAAVHSVGGAARARAQRRALMSKLDAESPGASKPPPALGPKLRVHPGPKWNAALGKYTFLFPGADSAVVRASQRSLYRTQERLSSEPYLLPQFGASFCVTEPMWAGLTAVMGALFGTLTQYGWGRRFCLDHAKLFTLGIFSDEGPTEEMLHATKWSTVFFGRGWAVGAPDDPPSGGLDREVRCSVSGPEPGYIATSQMFCMMARFVKEERQTLPISGGIFTPGSLVGAGGPSAVTRLVESLRRVGVTFAVDEPMHAITPTRASPLKKGGSASSSGGGIGAPAGGKRPAWQTALNGLALTGWLALLVALLASWREATTGWGSPLLSATLVLEAVCAFEVVQIALGMASGNLLLGVVLHYTRLLVALVLLPALPTSIWSKLVLLAWSATEVCRYPMFLLPDVPALRTLRYLAPVVTFPLGAFVEGTCAWLTLELLAASPDARPMLYYAVAGVLPVNSLGGVVAYPGLVTKALACLRPPKKRSDAKDS